jgi:hypothetical protein
MKRFSILPGLTFLLLAPLSVNAQYVGAWSSTWNNPGSATVSVMIRDVINRKMLEQSIANQQARRAGSAAVANNSSSRPARPQNPTPIADYAALRFRPVANSGVPQQIADTLGRGPQERTALLELFQLVKKAYEVEATKAGKANNIAAALTFFMAAASMAYHQTDEPSETVTRALVEVLQHEMSASPAVKSMTNLQKQQMHDWLVVSGGFILAGYVEAVKTNDKQELADYKEVAHECFKLVLGPGIEEFNLAKIK